MNKTILPIKSLLTVLLLVFSISLQAADKVTVDKNSSSSIVIEADETVKGDEIIIRNQLGNVLYREQLVAGGSFRKIFQFSLFDNGVYIISFQNDDKVSYYNVIKKDSGIKLHDLNNDRFDFKPVVKRDQDLAHVFLTNESLKNVELSIEDRFGEVLTSTNFNKELIIKRSFDLSRLPKGEYNLIIEVGAQTFTRTLNVQ